MGLTGGLLINYIYRFLRGILRLDSGSQPTGRTAKQYRKEKRKQKARAEAPLMSSGNLSPSYLSMSDGVRKGNRAAKGLISQTIMEEMDSDY